MSERWGWRLVEPDKEDKTVYVTVEEGIVLSEDEAKAFATKRLLANPYATTAYVWQMGERGGWKSDTIMQVGFEDVLGKVKWS